MSQHKKVLDSKRKVSPVSTVLTINEVIGPSEDDHPPQIQEDLAPLVPH